MIKERTDKNGKYSKELHFNEELKKKIEFICEFSHTFPTFINGSIYKVVKSNLNYIDIINNVMFLVFNYFKNLYVGNL